MAMLQHLHLRAVQGFLAKSQAIGVHRLRVAHTCIHTNSQAGTVMVRDVDSQLRRVRYVRVDSRKPSIDIPIVIIGGTAQTIHTWTPHINSLTRTRHLIIYETRGQGETELLPSHSTLDTHTNDFQSVMQALGVQQVDLVGFSFGGRVGLSVASDLHASTFVRKLSVTGVPLQRDAIGKLIVQSWTDSLTQSQTTVPFAWSALLNGYSDSFIERNSRLIPQWVELVAKANTREKLLGILKFSHADDPTHPFSADACVKRLRSAPTRMQVQVIAGLQDRLAHVATVRALAQAFRGQDADENTQAALTGTYQDTSFVEIDSGHLVPFEQPIAWRGALLEFLQS